MGCTQFEFSSRHEDNPAIKQLPNPQQRFVIQVLESVLAQHGR